MVGYLSINLTNHELSTMVDTNDEWIVSRTGIKKEESQGKGLGASDLGANAVEGLLKKKNLKADEIDLIICATATPDMLFPSTACIIADKIGAKNAFCFDLMAAVLAFYSRYLLLQCILSLVNIKK